MLGRWLSKKMMSKMNGGANPMNSMMFGGGKSNAKIYVKSSNGIKFPMWQERMRQRSC